SRGSVCRSHDFERCAMQDDWQHEKRQGERRWTFVLSLETLAKLPQCESPKSWILDKGEVAER
ncbi:hypothetical protein, partial [Mesorhizobium sp. M7A.F.Ca.MR.148.00.0.0]|uniref:hypothetical protein n=1 Tax=Mesorhizobium sp. M7A.F.Ca.MR.148.00.0.0 TaxID=2496775 RepID=UPI0019CF83F0